MKMTAAIALALTVASSAAFAQDAVDPTQVNPVVGQTVTIAGVGTGTFVLIGGLLVFVLAGTGGGTTTTTTTTN